MKASGTECVTIHPGQISPSRNPVDDKGEQAKRSTDKAERFELDSRGAQSECISQQSYAAGAFATFMALLPPPPAALALTESTAPVEESACAGDAAEFSRVRSLGVLVLVSLSDSGSINAMNGSVLCK